jgi:hypothetical protein
MKHIELSKLRPGDIIRAHVAAFTSPTTEGSNYFLVRTKQKWNAVHENVTLTIGTIINIGGGIFRFHTVEYGWIDTWVDTVSRVKCYTTAVVNKLLSKNENTTD